VLQNLTIENVHGQDTLNIDDSANTAADLVGVDSNAAGMGAVLIAPGFINFNLSSTSTINLTTGSGNDTIEVNGTGVTTNLNTSGGHDTIDVGQDDTGVQDVRGILNIRNAHNVDTIVLDDSVDTVARTATQNTFVSGGANWGSVTGLAPAAINYSYGNTTSVAIETGMGNDTINVLATGVETDLSSSGGRDTVNVGNAGSLQGIHGVLNIQNHPLFTTININDSADTGTHTALLAQFTSGGSSWGSIIGLSPAAINFKFADTSSPVNISTGTAHVTWVVSAAADASATGVVVDDNGRQIN
jgi:hypothetical protein